MVVVIEGMDAAGKQTHSKLLAEGMRGMRFAFPNYDSPTGAIILSHLKKEWSCVGDEREKHRDPPRLVDIKDVDARVFQSLQTVNRVEKLPEIKACIARGQHVVFDRYWQSAYVYGSLDGLDEAWLRLVQEKPMPPADVNILIDVPVEEGFKRRPERRDRYEIDRPFLERVRTSYISLWTASSSMGLDGSWYIVGGLGGISEVHARIREIVEREMAMRNGEVH